MEPSSGSAIRIKVTVDGLGVIDTDLTTAYLRTKYGGDDVLQDFWFVPFTPPDDDDETAPAEPIRAALRFTPLD